jgi:hypothetical protein
MPHLQTLDTDAAYRKATTFVDDVVAARTGEDYVGKEKLREKRAEQLRAWKGKQ